MEYVNMQWIPDYGITMAKQPEYLLWLGLIYADFSINVEYHRQA